MKIYDFPPSPNARKVRAVAYELGISPTWQVVNIFKGESRTPEMLAKNPNGRIPFLEDGDFVLWESNAIVSYLAALHPEKGLLPEDLKQRADVDRWLFWQAGHLAPAVGKVVFERVIKRFFGSEAPPDQAMIEAGLKEFQAACEVLDKSLASKEYLTGRLSVADFSVMSFLTIRELAGLDITPYKNLQAWQLRMEARDSVKKALADAQAVMAPPASAS
jgi:glutathione S-transferase